MNILAIETSCDETSAAVITKKDKLPLVLSNVVFSQIDLHAEFGGVVPEVAARAHIEKILPTINSALQKARLGLDEISHVAVTYGPGLIGSLIVGVETAKGICLSKKIPLIPINHLEGHLYASFISKKNRKKASPRFPILALIVSGGHTLLVLMKSHHSYKIVGKTKDDAAGEAFDKGAKLLGLDYPGGPIISKRAKEGDKNAFDFPIIDLTGKSFRNEDGFLRKPEPSSDFSFSGLKTSLLTKVKKLTAEGKPLREGVINDLAASFESAIIKNIIQNSLRATQKHQPKTFILSGGVAANSLLRSSLEKSILSIDPGITFFAPELSFCTDNAAMIGAAAFYKIRSKKFKTNGKLSLVANPSLKLEESA